MQVLFWCSHSLEMAELAESNMNFAALNKVDPYAKSLLETAAHVALYIFNNNEWEKTEIEGALFVYSRTGEPFHNILIMNRLNMKNLVEPVTQGLDLQLQDPFLLYRNSQGLIYGIWFYDKEECKKIATILTKIVRESTQGKTDKKETDTVVYGRSNVDIFSMLTKAQEEYNSKSPRKTPGQIGLGPHELNYNVKDCEPTPQSVMDFFAKASNGSKFVSDSTVPGCVQPPGMFIINSHPGPPGLSRVQSVPITIPSPQTDVKPLLQRLMSNPAHSVEHIEKQQQAITPQTDFVGLIHNSNSVLSTSNGSDFRNNLGFNIKSSSTTTGISENVSTPGGTVIPQGQIGFLRITDSPPTKVVHTQQYFNSKIMQNNSPLTSDDPHEPSVNALDSRPLSAPMESQSKPALMPPVMFTSSVKKEDNSESLSTALTITPSASNTYPVRPEPLTKNQLLQAVSYMLKYDSDFMSKLHEAYVKSFAERVQQ